MLNECHRDHVAGDSPDLSSPSSGGQKSEVKVSEGLAPPGALRAGLPGCRSSSWCSPPSMSCLCLGCECPCVFYGKNASHRHPPASPGSQPHLQGPYCQMRSLPGFWVGVNTEVQCAPGQDTKLSTRSLLRPWSSFLCAGFTLSIPLASSNPVGFSHSPTCAFEVQLC